MILMDIINGHNDNNDDHMIIMILVNIMAWAI